MNKSLHLIQIAEGYYGLNLETKYLKALQDSIDLPGKVEDLHITLMYSDSTEPVQFTLNTTGVEVVVNDARWSKLGKFVVIEFDSEYLQEMHNILRANGEVHSFGDYRPHISLFKVGEDYEVDLTSLPKLPRYSTVKVVSEKIQEVE